MFDLQGFRNAAGTADPGAILVLQHPQRNITSHSGPFARWFGRVRLVENHQATGTFLQALGGGYGAEIAGEVAAAHGLSRLGRVTPLTARRVANAVRAADNLQARVHQNNQLLADAVRRIELQGAATESIRTEIEREIGIKRTVAIAPRLPPESHSKRSQPRLRRQSSTPGRTAGTWSVSKKPAKSERM